MVGRWDPQKDHATLLNALAILERSGEPVRCALVGPGMDRANGQLLEMIQARGLGGRVILAGVRDDVAAVMNALDVHVLSSASEGFPNVVAEAMACNTPCVVTDVGDAALIVGDTGWVVTPRDAEALAAGIRQALSRVAERGTLECRARIEQHFDLQNMVAAYLDLWKRVGA